MVYDIDLDSRLEKKLKKIKNDPELSENNKKIILKYIRESKLGKTILKGQNKKIGSGRNLQVLSYLDAMCKKWFKKDLDKVTDKNMENFILDLDSGKIKSSRGTPFKSETQSNIKKFIRKFYKWLKGDGYNFPELVNWIDTSKVQADIKAIPDLEKGVEKIIYLIPDIKRKAIIQVLFDSGFRVGELLSVTLKDIQKRNDGIYYITCTESKTKKRTVGLPLSTDLLDQWLNEHPDSTNPNNSLFLTSRPSIAKTCKRYGMKALKIHIHPHMLRHTSATYYATRLNRTLFCKRYGWSYKSQSPDRYIDFSKVEEEKTSEIITTDRVSEIKRELEDKLKNERIKNKELKEEIKDLSKEMSSIVKNFAKVDKMINEYKSFVEEHIKK